MARPINSTNPIAAIRKRMGMPLQEFANFVGHGASMLRHVEAGRKPASAELLDKIHEKTGAPYEFLLKRRVSAKDAVNFTTTIPVAAYGGPGIQEASYAPLQLLPGIIALYFTMLTQGINPRLALAPIGREILRTVPRWNLDAKKFSAFHWDLHARFFSNGFNQSGKGLSEIIVEGLVDCDAFKAAAKYEADWAKGIERKMLAEYAVKAGVISLRKVAALGTKDALQSLADQEEAARSSGYAKAARKRPISAKRRN